ncbi:MAG TPA: DPP IV N-terminal domain-containing protein [Gemmatales bacterium]|nr:DPP IV N-terminal domain-containing protein [Gemmatales bacterium]
MNKTSPLFVALFLAATFVVINQSAVGQDRLKTMPGYEQYQKMSSQIGGSVKRGTVIASWKEGGKAFEYSKDDKRFRVDVESGKEEEVKASEAAKKEETPPAKTGGRRRNGGGDGQPQVGGPARGRQFTSTSSPDGKLKAVYKDRNLFITDDKGGNETPVTTDGSEKLRIKYGTASWVYGEELYQTTAMWWSPDSTKLAYYRFDESKVKDFFLQMGQTKFQGTMNIEPYPKAGTDNPEVDLFVYDVASKKSVRVDARSGKTLEDGVVGYYVYQIAWSPDGKEVLFNRTNRRQNIMEFCAADPATGSTRVIIREEWLPSWTENRPGKRLLKDNNRFIWTSDRTGFKNFYLYDHSGKLHATLTNHPFEVANIVRVDEEGGFLYYMAHDGDNPYKLQLHRVGLDGKGDVRLTDPAFNHAVDLAPNGKSFIDTYFTHDMPESARLVNDQGKVVAELTKSDMSKFEELGLKKVEFFTYKAGDGVTDLYGMLHFPSNFDPNKKYPLLVSVYAGPETNGARETFTLPSAMTEYGFLVATLDSRSAAGRGKKFLDAIYLKLGVTEIDDQAAGVKSLWSRPYLDKNRVGIYGTSYGGYASILCLLRHPDVFQAACASSPVTDYRHYDTIYTERYLYTPQENKKGYDEGSAMTYVKDLKGRLMIYYGTADDNVHPNNAMQLIQALQRAGKSFEVQVGPDLGHTGVNQNRMMEFFIENLVMRKD